MPTYHVIETYERIVTVEAKNETEAFEKVEEIPAKLDDFEFQQSVALKGN